MITSITVCVNFDDLLKLTLPKFRKLVDNSIVITDTKNKDIVEGICKENNAVCFVTDKFYENADFNKGIAIEMSLKYQGKKDWILIHDADILLPDEFTIDIDKFDKQYLYGCKRSIVKNPEMPIDKWDIYEKDDKEIAGYFQLFNCQSDALKNHDIFYTSWKHAGGCDSDFCRLYTNQYRQFLPDKVLHLGEHGKNWYGRVTKRIDGKEIYSIEAEKKTDELFKARRLYGIQNEVL